MSATRLTTIQKTDWGLKRTVEMSSKILDTFRGTTESLQPAAGFLGTDSRLQEAAMQIFSFPATFASENKPHSCHLWPPVSDLHAVVPKVALDDLGQKSCGSLDFLYTRWVATCFHFSACSEIRCKFAVSDG